MEYLQARVDSYSRDKSKRSKASSSRQAISTKWPHPSSFKATPTSLAEAGFYYDPDSDSPDNVTCFKCGKTLGGWEADDDPFVIHYDKCRNTCAWATVRCERATGGKSFDFSDPTRYPTSKAMEKARLDTFTKDWPHDEGHGANVRALASAGFICNAAEPEDDSVLCLYCNLSLSGWDPDDDPLEEHRKRDKKNKSSCPFLKAHAGESLSKSTAKRPTSKSTSKTAARLASLTQNTIAKEMSDAQAEDSDDELAIAPSDTLPTRSSTGRQSKASSARASSVRAKTPASRRSTRGTMTSGKTPGGRTVSSEVEETDAASESDAGKRSSKPKRKTGGRGKTRVSAIAEEETEVEPKHAAGEDIEMQDQAQEAETAPEPEPPKKKRGRPPKSAAAKPAIQSKGKKAQMKEEEVHEERREAEVDADPALAIKKTHGRTRSKANFQSDTDVPSTTAKPTHTRTKSGTKAKVKQEEEEIDTLDDVPAPPPKKGKQVSSRARREEQELEEEVSSAPPQKPKSKTLSRSKAKMVSELSDADDIPAKQLDPEQSHNRVESGRNAVSRGSKASTNRNSSLSEDAGYATAEPPPDHMDVDDELVTSPPSSAQDTSAVSRTVPPRPPRDPARPTPPKSELGHRPSPPSSGTRPPSRASSSRPSSSRPASKVNKDSLKVVEIDSDGENSSVKGPMVKTSAKGKAPASRANGTESTNTKKPTSHILKKKLQVEVVLPAGRPRPLPSSPVAEDVQMQVDQASHVPTHGDATPPEPRTPISAVHRDAQPSPERVIGINPMPDPDAMVLVAAPTSPRSYHPYLAQFPIEKLSALTEEEADMTLEQYIRKEMELQYAQMKADAERRIDEFKQKAAETRRVIETS